MFTNKNIKNLVRAAAVIIALVLTQAYAISSISELDAASLFHIAIMSDNKGDSVGLSHVRKWDSWARSAEFCLGLGDNLQSSGEPFLGFIQNSSHWKYKFFPNVADGENQHFSGSQGDWGTGYKIFNYVDDFFNRSGVTFRPLTSDKDDRKVDYKYVFNKSGFKVTIFSLHFSDQYDGSMGSGGGLVSATKNWLHNELGNIAASKSDHDVVIILAHSTGGDFIDQGQFSSSQKTRLIETADLAFSATTHLYGWWDRYGRNGVMSYNSGSVGHANSKGQHGYTELHFLDNPPRVTVQFISTEKSSRQLHVGNHSGYAASSQKGTPIIKAINGEWKPVDWEKDIITIRNETVFDTPKNNETIYEGGSLSVQVSAADDDGVERVYLSIDGKELLRSEGAAPYTWHSSQDSELANLLLGPHTLRARAVDRLGNPRSATITINVQKAVTVSSPAAGTVYASGDAVPMTAEATADIDYVRFWLDDGVNAPYVIIVENTPPFSKSALGLADGIYSVWAVGVDFGGKEYTSAPVSFTIGDGSTPTPTPSPTPIETRVTMTSPADGTVYTSGAAVPHVAEATENIDYIRFWLDDGINAPYVVIVENTPPFSKSAFGLADGSYTVWAVGVDFDGKEYTSAPVSFIIGGGPTPTPTATPAVVVDLTSPAEGAEYASGSSVPMIAEADAAVTDLVTFWLDNGVTDPSVVIVERVYPYSKSAYGLADGSYTVWAEATGTDGSITKSQVVAFTIGTGIGPTPTPTPKPEINLLQNPGFEEGKVVWTGFESKIWLLSSTAQEGIASARNIGGSDANLSQVVTIKPNTVYELSGWTRISAGSSGTLIIDTSDVFDTAMGGEFVNDKADNVWYEYKGSFNSGSATSVKIRSFSTGLSGTGRIDNLKLIEK